MKYKFTVLAIGVSLALVSGCKSKVDTTTYSTPQGNVTVKHDGSDNVTVTSPQGQTTMDSKNGKWTSTTTDANGKTSTLSIGGQFDLTELGIKIYPGATTKEGSSIKTDTPQGVSMTVTLLTKDDIPKIVDFYKAELKENTATTAPNGGYVSGKTPAGDDAVVGVGKEGDNNTITLTVVRKKQ